MLRIKENYPHVCRTWMDGWVSDLCLPGLTDIWFTSPSYGVMMSSREPSSPRPPHSVFIHIFVISSSLLSSSFLSLFHEQKEKKHMNMPVKKTYLSERFLYKTLTLSSSSLSWFSLMFVVFSMFFTSSM